MKWLIYGHRGWIGTYFCNFVKNNNYSMINLITTDTRVENIEDVKKDLNEIKPDRVISFIGRTSGPGFTTIDYLEQKGKLKENVRDNLFSPVVLMKLCENNGIHFTYLGTGCIFSYDQSTDPPFTETSKPNFFGSGYSTVKGFTDQLSVLFQNTLNVRIRMPIVEYDCPKNFISKIKSYPKICNTLNSMSVLPDLIPEMIQSIVDKKTGTVNLVNPGPIDHQTILDMYRKYIDANHTCEYITETEHDGMLLSQRSKNILVSSFNVPSTIESIEKILSSGKFNNV
jgi:3,5-epimerase/4-reductase